MTYLKFTDEEVIKILEAHQKGRCYECPVGKEPIQLLSKPCSKLISENALDLINRQKSEIERLQKLLDDKCDRCIARDRDEAIKEFAERFENAFSEVEEFYDEEQHENLVSANKVLALIDEIVEKMKGGVK